MEITQKTKKTKKNGFTLVELLVVVGIMTIVVGVTGDIVLSLVRSYAKTKVANEIEQVGSLAMLKLEKELRSASSVIVTNNASPGDTLNITLANGSIVTYQKVGTTFNRNVGAETENLLSTQVSLANTGADPVFTMIYTSPQTVRIKLVLQQSQATTGTSLTGQVELNQTIVLRSTY